MWENSKLEGEVILIEHGTLKKYEWENGQKLRNLDDEHFIFFEKQIINLKFET